MKIFIFVILNLLFIYFAFFSSQNLFVFVKNYFFYINFFEAKSKIFYITLFNIIFLISPYFLFENIFFEISKNVTSSKFILITSTLLKYFQ